MPGVRYKQKRRIQARNASYHQKQADRRQLREEYVRRVSLTGNIHCPFWNDEHHDAAIRYIETGIDSLKELFPSKVMR